MSTRTVRSGLGVLAAALTLQGCDLDSENGSRPSRITDARGDILASYTGPQGADLDVLRAEVEYDGAGYTFSSTVAGPLGTTAGALYVWGVNRGEGTARFADIAPGVLFDAVVILRADGTGSVRDLITNVATNLEPGAVMVNGSEIQGRVPASMLPPRGFEASEFRMNLWPRVGVGSNSQISDFAPDNSSVPVRDDS